MALVTRTYRTDDIDGSEQDVSTVIITAALMITKISHAGPEAAA